MSEELHRLFSRARLDDRQVNELVGLARGLIADGAVNQAEAEYLQKWLVANLDVTENPITSNLLHRVNQMLADQILDDDEASELFQILEKYSGGDFELGEVLKSTSLPFNDPAPSITYANKHFCFTGTFAYGCRRDCEGAIERLGGSIGTITKATNYLVIGIYATGSWKHSTYGAKIERAIELRAMGVPICIIGEQQWVKALNSV